MDKHFESWGSFIPILLRTHALASLSTSPQHTSGRAENSNPSTHFPVLCLFQGRMEELAWFPINCFSTCYGVTLLLIHAADWFMFLLLQEE